VVNDSADDALTLNGWAIYGYTLERSITRKVGFAKKLASICGPANPPVAIVCYSKTRHVRGRPPSPRFRTFAPFPLATTTCIV
jgi:hypothetical protein